MSNERNFYVTLTDLTIGNFNRYTQYENPEGETEIAIASSIVSAINTLRTVGYIDFSDIKVSVVVGQVKMTVEEAEDANLKVEETEKETETRESLQNNRENRDHAFALLMRYKEMTIRLGRYKEDLQNVQIGMINFLMTAADIDELLGRWRAIQPPVPINEVTDE